MKIAYLTLALLICGTSFAQVKKDNQKVKAGFGVSVVQTQPEFPGGSDSLYNFLINNLKYPRHAKLSGIYGRVYIGFLVDKTGKLLNQRLLSGVTDELNDEAMRVVKAMPDWKPGTRAGENIDVQYIMPIDFILPPKNEPVKE